MSSALHDMGKPACFTVDGQGVGHFYGHPKVSAALAEEVCRRLRMDRRTAREVVTLVQWHDRDIPRTEKAIARAVHQLGEDTFRRLLAIKRADNLAQHPDYRGRLTEIDRAEASSALSRELGRMQREGLLEFYRSSFRLKA